MSAIAIKQPPDEPKTGRLAKRVETEEMRAKAVELAKQGYSLRSIAYQLGYASSNSVSVHLEAYRASLTPSSELAEEWRAAKLARADERFRRLGEKALGVKDAATGEWIVEPDYQALTALQREEEAVAKLLGANLEPSLGFAVVTREQLAALLYDEVPAIEGTAEEIVDA